MTLDEFLERIDEIMCGTSNAERAYLEDLYNEVTKPHLISTIDETPPQNEAYLAYWQHLGVTKYRYVKAGAKVSRSFSEHVTHWMPLPQAPLVTDLNKKDLPPLSRQEGNILVEEEGGKL